MPVSTEDLWRRFERELRDSFARRIADPNVLDDLMQETFLRLHDHRHTLREEESVGGWLHRVARNLWLDRLRKPRPEGTPESLPDPEWDAPDDLNAVVASWLPPLLDELPPADREALRLAELEQLPAREVARRLDLSLTAAKSRIQRARQRLRDLVLRCCHVDLDRRGNVVEYRRRRDCEVCCDD